MANLTEYYAALAGASTAYRETTASDLYAVLSVASEVQTQFEAIASIDPSVFTGSLAEGLAASTEGIATLATVFQEGFTFDLTALGEDGLLGALTQMVDGVEPLTSFFGALTESATSSSEWVALSGESVLAGFDTFILGEEGKSLKLLETLGLRRAKEDEAAIADKEKQALADQQTLGTKQGFMDSALAMREQGLLAEEGLLQSFQDSQFGMLASFAADSFGMKLESVTDLVGLETDSQEGQNAVTAAGMMAKADMAAKVLGGLSSLMESENKNAFRVGQAAAIAEAGVNTALGAIKAYTSLAGIPFVGPAVGAIAAAAVVANGAKTINDIRSQQFGSAKKVSKPNFEPPKPDTAKAAKLATKAPSAAASVGPSSSGQKAGSGLGEEIRVKILVAGKSILDTTAKTSAANPLLLEAVAH